MISARTGSGGAFRKALVPVLTSLALAVSLLAVGCDHLSQQVPEQGDGGSAANVDNIAINLSSASVPADGASEVTVSAQVTHKGAGVAGLPVTFSVTGDSIFKESGAATDTQYTNGGGTAKTTLVAGLQPGSQTIIARVGGLAGGVQIVLTGEGPQLRLEVRETNVYANGTTTVGVVATLTASGRLVEGKKLEFTTDRGCFDAPEAMCPITKVTGPFGQASVNLRVPLLPLGTKTESVVVYVKPAADETFSAPTASDYFKLTGLGGIQYIAGQSSDACGGAAFPEPLVSGAECRVWFGVFHAFASSWSSASGVRGVPVTFEVTGPAELVPSSGVVIPTGSTGLTSTGLLVADAACGDPVGVTAVAGKDPTCDFCGDGTSVFNVAATVTFSTDESDPDCSTTR